MLFLLSKEPFKLNDNYVIRFQSLTADAKNFDKHYKSSQYKVYITKLKPLLLEQTENVILKGNSIMNKGGIEFKKD